MSKIFRASGLPANKTAPEVESLIYGLLEVDEKSRFKVKVTFIPSCEERESSSGLVEVTGGYPKFLSSLEAHPLEDCAVEMGGEDVNFDLHFSGFTQIYATAPGKPVTTDIIAITSGNAYESWRGEGNLGRMWLRDFCSRDLPNCRTMIYGQNSLLDGQSSNTILDYGREFLDKIKAVRYNKELRERPIIFIAHSWGGILLAHCLIKALVAVKLELSDHDAILTLYASTYGILFFGVPHRGMNVSGMVPADIHNILAEIEGSSDVLKYQLDEFKNLVCDRKIVSIYETLQTRRMQLDPETKVWGRTGEYMMAVESTSAILGLPDDIEAKIPVDADHDHIVKFNNKNHQTYKQVIRHLKEFELDAGKIVLERLKAAQSTHQQMPAVPLTSNSTLISRRGIEGQHILNNFGMQISESKNQTRLTLQGAEGIQSPRVSAIHEILFSHGGEEFLSMNNLETRK